MEKPTRRKGIPNEGNRIDEGVPDEKRQVPEILRQLLEWDRIATERFISYVNRNYPNIASKSEMKFMEVSLKTMPSYFLYKFDFNLFCNRYPAVDIYGFL